MAAFVVAATTALVMPQLSARPAKRADTGIYTNLGKAIATETLRGGGSSNVDATPITSVPYVDSGSTIGLGNNADLGGCPGNENSEDAWYTITLTTPATLTASTTCESVGPPSYDTRLAILDSSLNVLVCNDDAPDCGAPYYQSAITDYPLAAGQFYIVVDGYGGDAGDYELNVSLSDSVGCGSDSSNATPVTFPFATTASTIGGCNNIDVDCPSGALGQEDRWFQLTVATSVLLDVTTTCDGSSIDTRLGIFDDLLNQLYCDDIGNGCPTGQAEIQDAALAPGTYFVVVEASSGGAGSFSITMDTTHTPPSPALLPDIIVRESDLYDNDIVTTIEAGRTHLRLANGTANIGDGKLYVYGSGVDNGDGTEDIFQRIYRDDNTFYDLPAGKFVFHPTHNHIHVEDWSAFRLREVLPADGVGSVVAEGKKTSFCILDLGVYDSGLPNFSPSPEFNSCGSTVQGLSVGWVDVYGKTLSGQNIDITDVPDGTYWLESVVDPNDEFVELDENNNVARIKVTIGASGVAADTYEPNDAPAGVAARPEGGINSPNLGPCGPQRVVNSLTMHAIANDDLFRFYMNDTGVSGDLIRIDFANSQGNLDLDLLDAAGTLLAQSTGNGNSEIISLNGRGEGWYFARVVSATTNPDYTLTINPAENDTPSVTPINPPAGVSFGIHGQDTYTATWNATDPEGDLTWVTVYANTTPVFDGNEILFEQSVNTSGSQGFHIVNSSELLADTEYWLYFEVTDGGTVTGEWSPGRLKFVETATATGVHPGQAQLLAPMPNPFNPVTTLRLDLDVAQRVQWRIYDVRGAVVRTLADGDMSAGRHQRVWDGRDDHGRQVASGVYFQSVVTATFRTTNKLVLLK